MRRGEGGSRWVRLHGRSHRSPTAMTRFPRRGRASARASGAGRPSADWSFPAFAYAAAALVSLLPAAVAAADPEVVYPHAGVSRREYGRGATSYWLFEPAAPAPERAPVVVLNH